MRAAAFRMDGTAFAMATASTPHLICCIAADYAISLRVGGDADAVPPTPGRKMGDGAVLGCI